MTIEYCRLKPISIATDSELAQSYSQGYQDGRRGLEELIAALDKIERQPTAETAAEIARDALAKLAQPQPATKGE